jgi:hypothetical protein
MAFITFWDKKNASLDRKHRRSKSHGHHFRPYPRGDIVHIVLKDGRALEGVFRRMSIENNGGEGGWKFRGECEIETKDHTRHVLDYLDIRSASSVWNDPVSAKYQKLGLITLDHRNPTQ